MEGRVFISYSVKDTKMVKEIADTLSANEIDYWKAPEMIPAGSSYAREIPKAIKGCKAFLLVVSKDSQESIWVEKEVDMAVNERKPIIPVHIDDSEVTDVYRFYLNNVQMINYTDGKMQAITNMLSNLKASMEDRRVGFEKVYEPVLGTQPRPLFEDDDTESFQEDENAIKDNSAIERKRRNLISENKVPEVCEYCAGRIVDKGFGVYRCVVCGKDSYDYYRKVRNYLNRVGQASATTISVATGVPRNAIYAFFREEKLELPSNTSFFAKCKNCGKAIRTGEYCDNCKNRKSGGFLWRE